MRLALGHKGRIAIGERVLFSLNAAHRLAGNDGDRFVKLMDVAGKGGTGIELAVSPAHAHGTESRGEEVVEARPIG